MWPLQWTQVQPCPDLHLPPVNEFIPTEFDLKPREAEVRQPHPLVRMLAFYEVVVNNIFEQAPKVPVKLIGNDMMELWFKQDDRFNVPKMECRFVLCGFLLLLGFHLISFSYHLQAGSGFARGLRFAGAFGHELPLCRASRGTCPPPIMAPTSRVSFSKRVRGLITPTMNTRTR